MPPVGIEPTFFRVKTGYKTIFCYRGKTNIFEEQVFLVFFLFLHLRHDMFLSAHDNWDISILCYFFDYLFDHHLCGLLQERLDIQAKFFFYKIHIGDHVLQVRLFCIHDNLRYEILYHIDNLLHVFLFFCCLLILCHNVYKK